MVSPLRDRRVKIVKRVFDLLFGSILAILCLPLFLLIPILIKLDSRGPVFFAQERLGPAGTRIRHFKFRTMARDAESQLVELLRFNEDVRREYNDYHKLSEDPRLTRMGGFLRRHSMDELPQLLQVITGQLSLVGPRAYLLDELGEMGESSNFILQFQPGLTGWWQVNGRNSRTFQERLELDMYYLRHWSLSLDFVILLRTVWVVITGQGA